MHSSRTWFWVIALTFGLGIWGAVALDFRYSWDDILDIVKSLGQGTPSKNDPNDAKVPGQTGTERQEPGKKDENAAAINE